MTARRASCDFGGALVAKPDPTSKRAVSIGQCITLGTLELTVDTGNDVSQRLRLGQLLRTDALVLLGK